MMLLQELSLCEISMLSSKELEDVRLEDIDILFRANKEEYIGVIYTYTSLKSGKKYIGQTHDPQARHYTHISSSKINSKRSDTNSLFSKALRENGMDNFRYNILKICYADSLSDLQELLNKYERYYIAHYDTTNTTKGYNCERGGIGEPLGNTSHIARAVKQYTKSGKFIREYECINEAVRMAGISGSCISLACSFKPKRKTAGGYLWTYFDNDPDADRKSVV